MTVSASLPIALVEPQMQGVHHGPFNAALLHAVALAWPQARISFRSLPSHEQAVRSILAEHAPGLSDRLEWRTIAPPSSGSLIGRWRAATKLLREVLAPAERILFCSVSRMQLLQLKQLMRPGNTVRAIFHGELDRLELASEGRFPLSLLSLRRTMQRPNPPGFRPVLLGESIQRSIPAGFQPAFLNAGIIDHPYHFPPPTFDPEPANLTFGTFGNSGTAVMLEQVARAVTDRNPSIRFHLVGFVANPEVVARVQDVLHNAGNTPISRPAFIQQAQALTHTLWLAQPGHFRLRASGSFFDALAFLKPIVYTANPYIDNYFFQEPDIGTRCESAADVPEAILSLAAQYTPAAYRNAQQALLRLRERFTPAALAQNLPTQLAW